MKELLTSGQLLAARAKTQGKSVFYMIGDKNYTYKEVDDASNSVANGLMAMGAKKGTKICLLLGNTVNHVYTFFASSKIGTVIVPTNFNLTGDQLAHIVNNSDAEMLIAEADVMSNIESIQDKIAGVKTIILSGGTETGKRGKWNIYPFSQLLQASKKAPEVTVQGTDFACMLYTSGTTGLPKGVMQCQEYFAAGGDIVTKVFKETRNDILFATLPLYHIMGIMQGISAPLRVGASVALMDRFSVSGFWRDIDKYKATTCCLTGAQCTLLFQAPPKPDDAKHGVRVIATFPAPANISEEFEKRFKTLLRNVYGLTEALMVLTARLNPKEHKHGSLGKADDYEVRIADDADHALPDNKVGNLIFRPKVISRRVFDGYYKRPDATLEMLDHCWFHSGDLAYRDSDGFFWYSGRRKDVIRFRGENISATHLEAIISAHPAVKECTVIGVPSPISEEDVKVLAILKEGKKIKPEELVSFCEDQLVWFMVPRYVEFVMDFPRSATDKVQKNKLKENWKTPATWDRDASGYQMKKKAAK
jgi:crotonobetaine/carnitine-CoA ligase